MHPPPEPQPRHRRYSVRHQARLDAETHAKLEVLANSFHRKRAAILRYVMDWGLAHTRAWTIDSSMPDRPHFTHMLVEPDVLQHVQDAAEVHGVTVAAWLRHALRQVTVNDFPPSWRAEPTATRSHDSGYYGTRFMLCLDQETLTTLAALMKKFDRPAAEIIRQLIAQATPEDFPSSWHLAVDEQRQRAAQPGKGE
jgi:predicted DNA-binding protein